MFKLKEKLKSEEGSSTIEFLGILPFILLVVMIAWQLIVSVQAVVVAQSAANEAAKVYSITEDSVEATEAAKRIVNAGGSYLTFSGASGMANKDFTTSVEVEIDLVFLPKKIFPGRTTPSISFTSTASGKVIKNES
ncbi:TadE/TadG family type IV pilus assembly protein [Bacillus sp. es.034]|uniref:TadE/TadG family type IV pilus assembly protein n=1 Tax=Bacillus sp. es.034 TaxID=1761763 RepID=UPI000BF4FA02|nr:TadE/TadG family type IV pilus assembly protein [Bacillus sp. es.034]PFG03894.1 TadE-like protein [Bacillus sp. es.034]